MAWEIRVWGLTRRQAVVLFGIIGIATGGVGFILLLFWWLDYDKRSKKGGENGQGK